MSFLVLAFVIALIVHVTLFAGWFGLGLRLTRQARAVTAAEPSVGAMLAVDGAGTVRLMTIFAVGGYVAALIAFFLNPRFLNLGMAGYDWPYHAAMLLGLLLVAVQVGLVRGGWTRLRAAVGAPEADQARARVAMATGIGHALWLGLIVLMYWNRLSAAATL